MQQRVKAGECNIYHLPTDENPADFLTKWVTKKKLKASVRYITGGKHRCATKIRATIDKKRNV